MISARVMSSVERASQYPPSDPRRLWTSPLTRSSPRMFSRKRIGIPCAAASISPFAGRSREFPAAASSTIARTA